MKAQQNSEFTDDKLLTFWQSQLRASTHQPWLASLLLRQGQEIGRRYHYYYERLRKLPPKWRRALSRRLSLGLAGAALLLALSGTGRAVPQVHAAAINVDEDSSASGCTLADAITSANTGVVPGGSSCAAGDGSGPDTINLLADVSLLAALPIIDSEITIEGNSRFIERNGAAVGSFSLLKVESSGYLTLNDTSVRLGQNPNGAGIYAKDATLIVNRCTISGNIADEGGGIYGFDSAVTVRKSTINYNQAAINGGGLKITGTSVSIYDSTISGNFAGGGGGGVFANNTNLRIENSTISGNTAIAADSAVANGGGVLLKDSGGNSYSYFYNDTITTNVADGSGGGISAVDNAGGLTELGRSIISGNFAPTGLEVADLSSSTINSNYYNVVGYDNDARSSYFTPDGAKDIVPTAGVFANDILDITLANNGGPTRTHALVADSPAIDLVPNTLSGPFDQRGALRDVDGNSSPSLFDGDSGSYEYNSTVAITIQSLSASLSSPDRGIFALAVGGLLGSSLVFWNKQRREAVVKQ